MTSGTKRILSVSLPTRLGIVMFATPRGQGPSARALLDRPGT